MVDQVESGHGNQSDEEETVHGAPLMVSTGSPTKNRIFVPEDFYSLQLSFFHGWSIFVWRNKKGFFYEN